MKLLMNGDSNMSGEELTVVTQGIAHTLATLLNAEYDNLALTGSSNDRIYDSTMQYLATQKPDMVIIGWSEPCRVQWFLTDGDQARFEEINRLGLHKQPPEEYRERLICWMQTAQNEEYRTALAHYWHERIFNMHKWMQYQGIPHLFFNAFHDFRITYSQFQLNWDDCFVAPYDSPNCYVEWCQRKGYQEITPGFFHYEPAAQQAWAQSLYQHIVDHRLFNH